MLGHAEKEPVLEIDPRLILVFELHQQVQLDEFGRAQLNVLDASVRQAVVAFASDPQLKTFLDRLTRYAAGVTGTHKNAAHEPFFDSIAHVRPYDQRDRIQPRLAAELANTPDDQPVLIDVECWFPADTDTARAWLDDVSRAVANANGTEVDRYLNNAAGLALIRGRVPAGAVPTLARLDVIAHLDTLPEAPARWEEAVALTLDEFPAIVPAAADSPIVGLVDSGVRSAHPLLAGSIYDTTTVNPAIADGEDRYGHGTGVASRILLGPLEAILQSGFAEPPMCLIASVRVLDDHNRFPEARLWERDLDEAIRYCASVGARVVAIPIADEGTPFSGPRSTPVAALVDQLARELGLVIVLPSGNIEPARYAAFNQATLGEYPRLMLESPAAALLDPGQAALALTVGADVAVTATSAVRRKAIGRSGWPAPFSRCGPGVNGAPKPELVAPGGTFALDLGTNNVVTDPALACLIAEGRAGTTALVTTDVGTSYAVALVARVAAAVTGAYPDFGANLIRALVLQAVTLDRPDFLPTYDAGADGKVKACRRLVGYGEARLAEAVQSTDHRVVLVAEDSIEVDDIHVYEIPIPDSFFRSGGTRAITIALSYDPSVRPRRLDYLSSRMRFELLRGVKPEEIAALFMASDDEPMEEGFEWRDKLSELRAPERPKLEPPVTTRSAGTNQLGRKIMKAKLRPEDGETFVLIVQNTNRWAPEGSFQPYALAVALERSDSEPEIYAEVEAALQVEVRAEARAEAQIRA